MAHGNKQLSKASFCSASGAGNQFWVPLTCFSFLIAGALQWQVGNGSGSGGDTAALGANEREALRLEIARLENATAHLESSNVELTAALAEDPSDADFPEAIGVWPPGHDFLM